MYRIVSHPYASNVKIIKVISFLYMSIFLVFSRSTSSKLLEINLCYLQSYVICISKSKPSHSDQQSSPQSEPFVRTTVLPNATTTTQPFRPSQSASGTHHLSGGLSVNTSMTPTVEYHPQQYQVDHYQQQQPCWDRIDKSPLTLPHYSQSISTTRVPTTSNSSRLLVLTAPIQKRSEPTPTAQDGLELFSPPLVPSRGESVLSSSSPSVVASPIGLPVMQSFRRYSAGQTTSNELLVVVSRSSCSSEYTSGISNPTTSPLCTSAFIILMR